MIFLLPGQKMFIAMNPPKDKLGDKNQYSDSREYLKHLQRECFSKRQESIKLEEQDYHQTEGREKYTEVNLTSPY